MKMTVSVDPLTESNCYILTEGTHCIVIDPGESENLLHILEENSWEPELFLLTHEHCDHMAGLDALRDRYPSAVFAATARCNEGIQNPRLNIGNIQAPPDALKFSTPSCTPWRSPVMLISPT